MLQEGLEVVVSDGVDCQTSDCALGAGHFRDQVRSELGNIVELLLKLQWILIDNIDFEDDLGVVLVDQVCASCLEARHVDVEDGLFVVIEGAPIRP